MAEHIAAGFTPGIVGRDYHLVCQRLRSSHHRALRPVSIALLEHHHKSPRRDAPDSAQNILQAIGSVGIVYDYSKG